MLRSLRPEEELESGTGETTMEEGAESDAGMYYFENKDLGLKSAEAEARLVDKRVSRVVLKIGADEEELVANVQQLFLGSKYFDSILTEFNLSVPVLLPDLEYFAVVEAVKYLYTGFIGLSYNTVFDIYNASNKFETEELTDICLQFLADALTAQTCLEIQSFAVTENQIVLLETCEDFLKDNFPDVSQCPGFVDLEFNEVLRTITHCNRELTSNICIFKAITRWGQHSEKERTAYLPELLNEINFSELLDTSGLGIHNAFTQDTIWKNNEACEKKYLQACSAKLIEKATSRSVTPIPTSSTQSKTALSTSTTPSMSPLKETESPGSGSGLENDTYEAMEANDETNQEIDDYPPEIPVRNFLKRKRGRPAAKGKGTQTKKARQRNARTPSMSMFVRDPFIRLTPPGFLQVAQNPTTSREIVTTTLVFSVFEGNRKYLDQYNFTTKRRKRIHEIPSNQRKLSTLISYKNKIYDIGGTEDLANGDDDACVSSENVHTFTFGSIKNGGSKLLESRKEFGACVCQDYLYVVGGCQKISKNRVSSSINCVERFPLSLRSKAWERVDFMVYLRGCPGVAVLGSKIYAIGGIGCAWTEDECGDAVDLATVEVFDTERAEVEDNWKEVKCMNSPRGFPQTVVFQNKIYVLGGTRQIGMDAKTRRNLNSVEVYDPEEDIWSELAPMHKCRSRGVVGVIENTIYAIGGNPHITTPDYETYDVAENSWTLHYWPPELSTKHMELYNGILIDE